MTSGWGIFSEIKRENAALEEVASRTPPVACKHCGLLLQVRADGVRNCPAADFRYTP